MSRKRQPPWLLVTTSTPHGVAMVKSGPKGERELRKILTELSEAAGHVAPQWSMARGYVVSLAVIDYLRQYARQHGEWVLVKEMRREAG